jgi:drug/metabolite transporter (DMT)-like permease
MPTNLPTQVPPSQIPPVGWVAIGLLGIFALVMLVIALLDLSRRTDDQVLGRRRWVWLLVILFINSGIGALIYLVAGRKSAPADDVVPAKPASERAEAAADSLYGDSPKEGEQR